MKNYRPNDPREYPSKVSWGLHSAEAHLKFNRRRRFKRIGWALLITIVIAATISRCRASEFKTWIEPVMATGSMRGWMPAHATSHIIIDNRPLNQVKVGDVVVYIHPRWGKICHRVSFKWSNEKVIVKGDSNSTSDDVCVTPANYHGTVELLIPASK